MKFKFFLVTLAVLLISLFALYPSFSLALLGDDWLAFFRYFQHLGPRSPGAWNHLTYFLTPYGAQDIMMGLLQKTVGYDSTWYYLTSFVLRLGAAVSLYPLVYYLTKSKLGSLFAVLFFAVTVTGFDTTNWSSNMTTYVTIALFNLFLYYFLKSREINPIKFLPVAAILYYLAYVTTPIRMHGSMPFIFLLEAFWVIQERNAKTLKKAALRLAIILGVFLIIRYTGQSQGPTEEATQRFGLGIKAMSEMLQAGRFDFLFYPIIMFGNIIIPDFILPAVKITSKSVLFFSMLLPAFSIFLISGASILKDLSILKIKYIRQCLLSGIIWTAIVLIIYLNNPNFFNYFNDFSNVYNSRYIFSLLVGGYAIIVIIFPFLKYLHQKNNSNGLFLGLSWSMLSFFFAWWWVPNSIFPTTYRYLIVSAVGVSILLATIISLGKERKQQVSLFAALSIILILHIVATRIYIGNLLNSHSQAITEKIWSSIPKVNEIGKSKDPIIFYFEGDGTNGEVLHDVITFGFPPRMAILYNLREEDGGFPVPMDDIRQVVSAVTDGKAMTAYGYPVKPVPTDRIYAFRLQGQDNLINITDLARNKLEQIKSGIKQP